MKKAILMVLAVSSFLVGLATQSCSWDRPRPTLIQAAN